MMTFEIFFGKTQTVQESAPGRVNLLGEHTDYNDGFVLPIATPMRTYVNVALSEDDVFQFYSTEMLERVILPKQGHLTSGYGRYLEGCIRMLERSGHKIPPLRIYITSAVPLGAGLSSSAALEVATLRAIRTLLRINITDIDIAKLAQKAEIAFANVNIGIMDQMAASLCDESHMLFLDTRSLVMEVLSLPQDSEVLVLDSGIVRTLGTTKYNERRAECCMAARLLGVKSLRDVVDLDAITKLGKPYRQRARHVFTENLRVTRAAQGVSAAEFGKLMNESHASLRDDYEVSTVALDNLCDLLRESPNVHGARLTGAGFGGACVALCHAGSAASTGAAVLSKYNARGRKGRLLVPDLPVPGAKI